MRLKTIRKWLACLVPAMALFGLIIALAGCDMPPERPKPPKMKYRIIIDVECRNPPAVQTTTTSGTDMAYVRTTGYADGAVLRVQVFEPTDKPEMEK